MTDLEKEEITRISKEFVSGFEPTFKSINGTGWMIVEPLAAYLETCGFSNELHEVPKKGVIPQVMVIEFRDGSKFIPAGGDLKAVSPAAENYMWI